MNTTGMIIEALYKKMSLLNKMTLDSLSKLSQMSLISDCPKKWIP